MAKKKETQKKSKKKAILKEVERKLVETLTSFPKKISEKKYKKTIRKAGKILTTSISVKPVRSFSKNKPKIAEEKKPEVRVEAVS